MTGHPRAALRASALRASALRASALRASRAQPRPTRRTLGTEGGSRPWSTLPLPRLPTALLSLHPPSDCQPRWRQRPPTRARHAPPRTRPMVNASAARRHESEPRTAPAEWPTMMLAQSASSPSPSNTPRRCSSWLVTRPICKRLSTSKQIFCARPKLPANVQSTARPCSRRPCERFKARPRRPCVQPRCQRAERNGRHGTCGRPGLTALA